MSLSDHMSKAFGLIPATTDSTVAAIVQQAQREEAENSCTYSFLDRDLLMAYSGKAMPVYQEIMRTHPQMLVPFKISFTEACNGLHVEQTLTVSHRWMSEGVADIDGTQLDAIRAHLERCDANVDHMSVPLFADAFDQLKTRALGSLMDTEKMDTVEVTRLDS